MGALNQADAFTSNAVKKAPTCLNSSYNPVTDARPQTDTYRQGSPDMGYAVRDTKLLFIISYIILISLPCFGSWLYNKEIWRTALLILSRGGTLPHFQLLKVIIHPVGRFSIIRRLLRSKEDLLKHGRSILQLLKLYM